MKNVLAFFILILPAGNCFAQCTNKSGLRVTTNACVDTLIASSSSSLSKIVWLNENTIDTTATAVDGFRKDGVTVAGGNGAGAATDQLNRPSGICVDAFGNLYVADPVNNRIMKFPPGSTGATNGTVVAGGNGPGAGANQLDGPISIFVDVSGFIYVADFYNSRIQQFPPGSSGTTNGKTVAGGNGQGAAANQFYGPTCVSLDGFGNMYVCDQYNNRIQKFPPGSTGLTDGVTIAGGNGQGGAANQLNGPYSLFIDRSGNIYVADFNNFRVQKFPPNSTSATNGITVAGGNGFGTNANQVFPSCMYIDSNGYLYITDMILRNYVVKFPPGSNSTTNGEVLLSGNGDDTVESAGQYGMTLDAAGNIYTSDIQGNRIIKFGLASNIDSILVPDAPGTYTAITTDGFGCTDTTNAIVIAPVTVAAIRIDANKTSICAGDTVIFSSAVNNTGPAPVFQWQLNGKSIGTNSDTLISSSLADGDQVNCILTPDIPCTTPVSSANNIMMIVHPAPIIIFNPDTLIVQPGNKVTLDPGITGNIVSYQWQPGSTLDNPFAAMPVADPINSTVYQLTATTDNGCSAFAKVDVFVYYELKMPNAFTPNGDGKNDIFRIPLSTPQEIKSFSVFNRWGQRVFYTNDAGIGWDGTFNGNSLAPDGYVWIIKYYDPQSHIPEVAKGTVMLCR